MIFIILVILLSMVSFSDEPSSLELERLNFFPRSRFFFNLDYEHGVGKIESKKADVAVKAFREYSNTLTPAFAFRIFPRAFLGSSLRYENTVESAVRYGDDDLGKHTSKGFNHPGIFTLIRLREQNAEHGILDLNLSFHPYTGYRKIGEDNSNRKTGRWLLMTRLSHGLAEEQWEFRSSLTLNFHGEGKEKNLESGQRNNLSSFTSYQFLFEPQYTYTPRVFIKGGIGFIYQDVEEITSKNNGIERDIQVGTASIFNLGLKYKFSERWVGQINYTLMSSDYFVKSPEGSLDGDRRIQVFNLGLVTAFN